MASGNWQRPLVIVISQVVVGCCIAAPPTTSHYAKPASLSSDSSAKAGVLVDNDTPVVPTASRLPEYRDMIPTWQKCAEITGVKKRLEALPGTGWDTLSNKDMGYVFDMSYDKCQTTPDGEFLIPDNVVIIPLQKSEVQQYADLYKSFNEYRSATSQSMNLDIGFSAISGSFSDEYQKNKLNQVALRTATTRVQVRHELYLVEIKPDAPLAPALKSRLLGIASLLQNNFEDAASYEMSKIVRDYGTHVIRAVVAGGALVHEDQVKSDFFKNHDSSATSIKATASANFFVKIGFSFDYSTSSSAKTEYLKHVAQSTTRTYGGPPFRPGLSINDWENGLLNRLVAVDRRGDPIEFTLSSFTLSELPVPTLRQVASGIEEAARDYVEYNTIAGCTDQSSINFEFQANDGESAKYCQKPPNNYTFGGIYQTCRASASDATKVCDGLEQKNPLSGGLSCPRGYHAILLHQGKKVTNWNKQFCRSVSYGCGFLGWKRCSRQVCEMRVQAATAHYDSFWCVQLDKVGGQSGYLFGGVYTAGTVNPVTQSRACPEFFTPVRFGASMYVCVSNNYERGFAAAVLFAGFFSCRVGNPLSLPAISNLKSLDPAAAGKANWPSRCPEGYSQHLADIDDFCEVKFCVKSRAFNKPKMLSPLRPPYGDSYPSLESGSVDTTVVVGPAGERWVRNSSTGIWEKEFTPRGYGQVDGSGGSQDPTAMPDGYNGGDYYYLNPDQQDGNSTFPVAAGQADTSSSNSKPNSVAWDKRMIVGVSCAGVFLALIVVALVVTCRTNRKLKQRLRHEPLLDSSLSTSMQTDLMACRRRDARCKENASSNDTF